MRKSSVRRQNRGFWELQRQSDSFIELTKIDSSLPDGDYVPNALVGKYDEKKVKRH